MPSGRFAGRIEKSLGAGEEYEDFAYLFDTVLLLRQAYNQDLKLSEEVVGGILCVFTPAKPEKYIRAMQEFRLRFARVSTEPQLQAEFSNCVRNAALTVHNPNEIVWTPSVYFRNPWRAERVLKDWF